MIAPNSQGNTRKKVKPTKYLSANRTIARARPTKGVSFVSVAPESTAASGGRRNERPTDQQASPATIVISA
jgi:hypothetical protein